MDNIIFRNLWIDNPADPNSMIIFEIEASSDASAAKQECRLVEEDARALSEAMVFHSLHFDEKHHFKIDDRLLYPELSFVMHEANARGIVPLELAFHLQDETIGPFSSKVIVRAELGQLERLGKSLSLLARKPVGSFCALNPIE